MNIKKNITESLNILLHLKKRQRLHISLDEFKEINLKGIHSFAKGSYKIFLTEGISSKRPLPEGNKKIEFKLNGKSFYSESALFRNPRPKANKSKEISLLYNIELSNFKTMDFKENDQFFRSINILEKDIFCFWSLEKEWFSCEKGEFRNLLEIRINDILLHIMFLKQNEINYLIIDCMNKTDLSIFTQIYISFLHGYGLITGNFIQNEYFIFSSTENDFSQPTNYLFRRFKSNKYFNYPIIDYNVNHYKGVLSEDEISQFDKKLNYFSQNSFSFLCKFLFEKSRLLNSLNIILESSSYPLITQTACYSVALETIGDLLKEKKDNKIFDSNLFEKLKEKLLEVISEFQENKLISEAQKKGVVSKINNINSKPNSDKLKFPFEYYKITLSSEDLKAINLRNKFLHGS
jgi:hypothetical protein